MHLYSVSTLFSLYGRGAPRYGGGVQNNTTALLREAAVFVPGFKSAILQSRRAFPPPRLAQTGSCRGRLTVQIVLALLG